MSLWGAPRERPVAALPAWILAALAGALAAQLLWQVREAPSVASRVQLPPAPSAAVLSLAGFGETSALARLAMVWLLAFDSHAGNAAPYQSLDYGRLAQWLQAILSTDPRSNYPLFAAARVYAENDDAEKVRRMCEFVYEKFSEDPNRRWPLLAHAALIAKHRLHDLPLARRYAAALQQQTTDPTVPSWARQMEIFILEDMNELQAAKVMLGGLLATGQIRDAEERRFLEQRLGQLEARLRGQAVAPGR